MSAEYSPFARPNFTAADFARDDETGRFDVPANGARSTPRAPISEPRSFMADREPSLDAPLASASYAAAPDPAVEAELTREDEMLLDQPIRREARQDETPMFAAAPIASSARTRSTSGRRIPTGALVAIPAVALLAGAGYLAMSRGQEAGVAQKAPGETMTTAAAPAFGPASSEPTAAQQMTAEATPPVPVAEPATPRVSARVETAPTRVARARPAPAPAADASSAGVDASATLPAAPIPYSGTAQTSSAAPAPIIVPPPPATSAAPAPEPVNPPPAAVTPTPAPSSPEAITPEPIEPPTL